MTTVFHARLYGRFIDTNQPQGKEALYQGSIFLGGSFSNGDNVRAQIQFRQEKQLKLLTS